MIDITVAEPSNDATLSSLSVDTFVLIPPFDKYTYIYNIELPPGIKYVNIIVTPTNPYATITGGGIVDVSSGYVTSTITVTAKDGTQQNYYINFTVTTAIKKIFEEELKIYYNSATNSISVINGCKIEHVDIYDITGKLLIKKVINNKNDLVNINVSQLNSGIFVVKAYQTDNKFHYIRFIK